MYTKNSHKAFIFFILSDPCYYYEGYEEDKKNNPTLYERYSKELVEELSRRYSPDNYDYKGIDEKLKQYLLMKDICSRINIIRNDF